MKVLFTALKVSSRHRHTWIAKQNNDCFVQFSPIYQQRESCFIFFLSFFSFLFSVFVGCSILIIKTISNSSIWKHSQDACTLIANKCPSIKYTLNAFASDVCECEFVFMFFCLFLFFWTESSDIDRLQFRHAIERCCN